MSVVHDYMNYRVPREFWTRPIFNEYQEILDRLAKLDEKLSQPDCEDPAKAAYLKEIEERLSRLEAK